MDGESMKPLEAELVFQGRTLRQLKRKGMIAIYEIRSQGEMLRGYEVIVIRIRRAEEAFGRSYPEREVYPGNEDWGIYGWSYQACDKAGAQKGSAVSSPNRPGTSPIPPK